MGNAFRRTPWQVFGLVIGLLYGGFITVLVVGSLIAARAVDDTASTHSVVVVIGSVVVAGFALLPLLFGVDDTLDPREFSLFGIPNRTLAIGLLLAGLLGIPSFVLIVCSAATVITWSQNPGTVLVALISAVVVVLTCVLASRVTTAIAHAMLSTRRSR